MIDAVFGERRDAVALLLAVCLCMSNAPAGAGQPEIRSASGVMRGARRWGGKPLRGAPNSAEDIGVEFATQQGISGSTTVAAALLRALPLYRVMNLTARAAFPGMTHPHAPVNAADHRLSAQMMGYWVTFAERGDPNGENRPLWVAFEPAKESVMHFSSTGPHTRSTYRVPQLDWMESKLIGPSVW